MATGRGITDTKIYDREAVIDRYGIPPESIPDFYGLKGDTSDNIPGVPGIGDKTAADLLQRFGDLETVLASVDEISGAKRKENLTNHAEDARVSKQLATSIRDVPVEVDFDDSLATRAGPLAPARDVPRVRAARPAAAARGGVRRGRRGGAADRAVGHAEGAREGGGAVRAGGPRRRPRRARRGAARCRPRTSCPGMEERGAAALRRLRRRRHGAHGRGGDARRGARGLGRPAGHRARLQVAGGVRGPVDRAAAGARHGGGGLPDRSRPPQLSARRAGLRPRPRRRGQGRRRRGRGRGAHARAGRAPAGDCSRSWSSSACSRTSSCRSWTCWWRWSARA